MASGRPGPPPKPVEQKRRAGNPGKRPLPALAEVAALPAAEEPPDPLRPLGRPGRELWDRVWSAAAVWVSPQTDVELLQLTCELIDERSILRAIVIREGAYHERQSLRALDAQIISCLSLLGFTPSDRTRLGVAEVVAQSTLAKLRANRGSA